MPYIQPERILRDLSVTPILLNRHLCKKLQTFFFKLDQLAMKIEIKDWNIDFSKSERKVIK